MFNKKLKIEGRKLKQRLSDLENATGFTYSEGDDNHVLMATSPLLWERDRIDALINYLEIENTSSGYGTFLFKKKDKNKNQ